LGKVIKAKNKWILISTYCDNSISIIKEYTMDMINVKLIFGRNLIMIKVINTNDFAKEVENDNGVVVVDFFAEWCGPCKMLAPVFKNLDDEIGDKVKFMKVDIDKDINLAEKFQITSVPTMIVFKNGKPVDAIMGFRPKDMIKSQIETYL
jgi:thioredoxin 1